MRPSRIILSEPQAGGFADTNAFTVTIASAATTQEMYVKDAGVFKQSTPNVKVGGVWQEVDAYVKSGGVWVQVHEK